MHPGELLKRWAPQLAQRAAARPARPRPAKAPAKPSGPVVVMIHGLAQPRFALRKLQWHLERKYQRRTANLPFNTWAGDIPALAEQIARQVRALGVEEFDAVTHSMGGILLRWAINNHPMPRLRRAVLVGPPNDGSQVAALLSEKLGPAFPLIWGPCALQLLPGEHGVAARAGRLDGAEVGIIAGGTGTPAGVNNVFRLPKDNDRIVTVEETILPGMKDFVLLNHSHLSLLFSSQTAHMANLFLEHGVFRPKVAGMAQ